MRRQDLSHGGYYDVFSSVVGPPLLVVKGADIDLDWFELNLTPDEARGLAQRLLKEAAEVEFAGKLHDEAAKP